jgi:hypothetical protein
MTVLDCVSDMLSLVYEDGSSGDCVVADRLPCLREYTQARPPEGGLSFQHGMTSRSISTRKTRKPAFSTSLTAEVIADWRERAFRANNSSIPSG